MIEQLSGHLTEQVIQEIVDTILRQYRTYRAYTGSDDYRELFSEVYSAHRREHSLSWAINSAFPDGMRLSSGIEVSVHQDGGNHRRPVLRSDNIVIFILNNTTNYHAKYLKEQYALNRFDFSRDTLFCYIKYIEKEDQLFELSLCLPDENGVVVAQEMLKDEDAILQLVA